MEKNMKMVRRLHLTSQFQVSEKFGSSPEQLRHSSNCYEIPSYYWVKMGRDEWRGYGHS